ncbi:MAG: methionyl-tRNA formyltransferase, partial [Clostridia bacterium]|nr:methionyl-tRNA formyltransferase [Clostridia bacterium]
RDKTGVTAMLMDIGLDTGDMLMKAETSVDENETIDSLHDRLSQMGAELIVKVVHDAEKGLLVREKQDDSKSSYVGMLTKDMMKMDFTRSAKKLHDLVRALTGTAFLDGKRVKIYRTLVRENKGEAGEILSLNPFIVACGEGSLEILEIQPEGKKRMSAKDFANGLKNTGTKDMKFS